MRGTKDLRKAIYKSKVVLKKQAPTILSCIGVAGVVATGVMSAKATLKVDDVLRSVEETKGDELTTYEKVKNVAPLYIPTALVATATIACIAGSNILSKKQNAVLVGAYMLLSNNYKQYRAKVVETYGEETHNAVQEAIAKERYPRRRYFYRR